MSCTEAAILTNSPLPRTSFTKQGSVSSFNLAFILYERRAPNGLASYADEMSTLADGPLQRSVEAYQTQSSKAGRSNALCICAFLSLQLDQPASALQYALELLNVRYHPNLPAASGDSNCNRAGLRIVVHYCCLHSSHRISIKVCMHLTGSASRPARAPP